MSKAQIDAFIAALPEWQRGNLTRFREAVHRVAPAAEEGWKWDVPVFLINGRLVCAMSSFAKHTKYNFFDGAALADPDHLFNSGLEFEEVPFDQPRRGRGDRRRSIGPAAGRGIRGGWGDVDKASMSAPPGANQTPRAAGFALGPQPRSAGCAQLLALPRLGAPLSSAAQWQARHPVARAHRRGQLPP